MRMSPGEGWTLERLIGERALPPPPYRTSGDSTNKNTLFRTQHDYGPKGHLICTAVCYALAYHYFSSYDNAEEEEEVLLDPRRVDACMRACHAFFEDANLTQPLMLAEMQRWFPFPSQVAVNTHELAGLLTNSPAFAADKGLVLLPLDELVHSMVLHNAFHPDNSQRWALVFTCQGHTRLLLTDGWLFDPQALRPHRILAGTPAQALKSLGFLSLTSNAKNDDEYAGLFLSRPSKY